MKQMVGRKIFRQMAILIVIVIIVLGVGTYYPVSIALKEENTRFSQSMAHLYADLLSYDAVSNNYRLDTDENELMVLYAQTLCDYYGIDELLIYRPIENGTKVEIVKAVYSDRYTGDDRVQSGDIYERPLTDYEQKVWNREIEEFNSIPTLLKADYIVTTIMMEDNYGEYLVCCDYAYGKVIGRINRVYLYIAIVLATALVTSHFIQRRIIKKHVSDPIATISTALQEFISDGKRNAIRLPENTDDEFGQIARAFNNMTDSIDAYMSDINTLTRDQANRDTEMKIASGIQQGFLPGNELIKPDYEVRGIMIPAKDIGGDFYDYVPLENDKLLIVIGDVSGKGVIASMFMSVTLALIRQFAKLGFKPDEILCRVNDMLSDNNAAMLFATAFVGIYDTRSKVLTYSNAGHNLPYVTGTHLRQLDGAHGTLLGLFPGETYVCETVQLDAGDTVFLYTDGVTEAINSANEFFGDQRLESVLRDFLSSPERDLIAFVQRALLAFRGDADPHDDITMLTLFGRQRAELSLKPFIQEQPKINQKILELDLPRDQKLTLCLAAEEIFVNICSYAFEEKDKDKARVKFILSVSDRITLQFEDRGKPYNPLTAVQNPDEYDLETQIGGLGKLICFTITDEAKYEYRDGKNILTLTKYLKEENT